MDFMEKIGWASNFKTTPTEYVQKRILRTGDVDADLVDEGFKRWKNYEMAENNVNLKINF